MLDESHYYLGILLTAEERYEEAEKEYKQAIDIKPTNADYLNSLGSLLGDLGHHKKAKECFKNAIHFDPTHINAQLNLRELEKIPEIPYRIPIWLLYGVPLFIAAIIIAAHCSLLLYNKLSGAEFTAFITLLVSLLIIAVLAPVLKSAKAGPLELNFLRETEGKPMNPEP